MFDIKKLLAAVILSAIIIVAIVITNGCEANTVRYISKVKFTQEFVDSLKCEIEIKTNQVTSYVELVKCYKEWFEAEYPGHPGNDCPQPPECLLTIIDTCQ